jgi:hypothetical protein
MAATGGRPAFAAALTIPFFQDNLLKDESNDISRKFSNFYYPILRTLRILRIKSRDSDNSRKKVMPKYATP